MAACWYHNVEVVHSLLWQAAGVHSTFDHCELGDASPLRECLTFYGGYDTLISKRHERLKGHIQERVFATAKALLDAGALPNSVTLGLFYTWRPESGPSMHPGRRRNWMSCDCAPPGFRLRIMNLGTLGARVWGRLNEVFINICTCLWKSESFDHFQDLVQLGAPVSGRALARIMRNFQQNDVRWLQALLPCPDLQQIAV
ncbi:hypothetical protein B0T19DRAFT_439859 [Cercophora scortea]|uniref:Uncharacterized protein n=1 Tax=Cercophora scortea TaxID=314031 RepID=A0AAE0IY52_9PEZI|nr:hypothetical protein B0T19DRAFT_439859 [Cercophora scortea]